jgi:hypothetical protein
MLDVAMPKIVLDQSRIGSLIRQSEAATVAQHMRVSGDRKPGLGAVILHHQPDRDAAKRLAALAVEKKP